MEKEKVKESILSTFHYREVFEYPLSFYQSYTYLISPTKIDFKVFSESFEELVKERKLTKDGDFYHKGTLDSKKRLERELTSKELEKIAVKTARSLRHIPFVQLVCVTGAVAAYNAPLKDDVDILVVTSKNRLWITRFISVVLLKVLNLYRTDLDENGKVCPNIFVSEDFLSWSHNQNIYTAHELMLMRPVFDRSSFYFKFLKDNLWVREFLPHAYPLENLLNFFEFPRNSFPNPLLNLIEKVFMKLQLWYMKDKRTTEITTSKLIHFKKNDHTTRVLTSFVSKS